MKIILKIFILLSLFQYLFANQDLLETQGEEEDDLDVRIMPSTHYIMQRQDVERLKHDINIDISRRIQSITDQWGTHDRIKRQAQGFWNFYQNPQAQQNQNAGFMKQYLNAGNQSPININMNVDKDGAEGKENEAKELKNELSTVKSTINELNAELIKIKKDNAARSEEEANEGSSATSDDQDNQDQESNEKDENNEDSNKNEESKARLVQIDKTNDQNSQQLQQQQVQIQPNMESQSSDAPQIKEQHLTEEQLSNLLKNPELPDYLNDDKIESLEKQIDQKINSYEDKISPQLNEPLQKQNQKPQFVNGPMRFKTKLSNKSQNDDDALFGTRRRRLRRFRRR